MEYAIAGRSVRLVGVANEVNAMRPAEIIFIDGAEQAALVAVGMLAYSVMDSTGHFLAPQERGPVGVFGALAACSVGAAVILVP